MCDHKKYTAYTGTVSQLGLALIYRHAAHRLVQDMLQVVEVALTNDSTLFCPILNVHRHVNVLFVLSG